MLAYNQTHAVDYTSESESSHSHKVQAVSCCKFYCFQSDRQKKHPYISLDPRSFSAFVTYTDYRPGNEAIHLLSIVKNVDIVGNFRQGHI